jgi:hypothetical protein
MANNRERRPSPSKPEVFCASRRIAGIEMLADSLKTDRVFTKFPVPERNQANRTDCETCRDSRCAGAGSAPQDTPTRARQIRFGRQSLAPCAGFTAWLVNREECWDCVAEDAGPQSEVLSHRNPWFSWGIIKFLILASPIPCLSRYRHLIAMVFRWRGCGNRGHGYSRFRPAGCCC